MSLSVKRSFFPSAKIEQKHMKPHWNAAGPSAKVRGKPSQTPLKKAIALSEMIASVLQKKNFYLDSPAVLGDRKMKLTFRALDEISTRLAQNLTKILRGPPGLGPNSDGDTVIAFMLDEDEKDEKAITLILAILKLGVTFMALGADEHSNDLIRALTVVKPVLLINGDSIMNDSEMQEAVEKIKESMNIAVAQMSELWTNAKTESVSLDKNVPSLDIGDNEYWSDVPFAERTVAIYFTAGSGGSPHGVRVGVREIYNRLHYESKVFPEVSEDSYALTSSLTDPRSLTQIMTALLAGKPLTIIRQAEQEDPSKLIARISEVKLTRLNISNPVFENVIDYIVSKPDLKSQLLSVTHWTVTGSRLSVDHGQQFFRLFRGAYKSGIFLITMYGTTEVFGESSFEVFLNAVDLERKISPIFGNRVLSVGVPISNTSISIVDEHDKTLPLGFKGEICISGACLSSGGYVGQGSWTVSKYNVNSNASNLDEKHHIILFRTGDVGRILMDKSGVMRLYVEGRVDSKLKTNGQIVDLDELLDQVVLTGFVKDAVLFTYHRGRDNQVIVAACVLQDNFTALQVMEKLKLVIPKPNAILPEVFAVSSIPLLSSGRVNKKELRSMYRQCMLECEESKWETLDLTVKEQLATAKFLCKAIALSLGISLEEVIDNYENSFWDIGGSALNVIMAVKICNDNGYPISLSEFVSADSLSQLTEKMSLPKGSELPLNEDRDKFSIGLMTSEDEDEVIRLLQDECYSPGMTDTKSVNVYWKAVIDSVRKLKMCIVVKMSIEKGEQIVGVAIAGDADATLKLPKTPKEIAYGLEFLETCQTASRYQMWRKISGRVAKVYYIGVKESFFVMSPGESAIIIQQLLSQICMVAQISLFSSILITTTNPLIQEAATHLMKFESLLEFPVSRFKAKDKNRPFTYADDHHNASVMIKNISRDTENVSQIGSVVSQNMSTISARSSSIASQKPSHF